MILPLWLLGLLMVGGATALSVAGLAIVRRRVAPHTLRDHHDVAGFILAIVGVIYAVLLAFVVLVVWERYENAELIATREANALIDVYRLAPALPNATATIRRDANAYAREVVKVEWPAMSRGAMDDGTSRALDQLWRDCLRVKPRDNRESAVFSQILDRLTEVGDNRRLRLLSSRTGVPSPIWLTLIVGGIATILFTFYFGLERFSAQAGMTAILALLISLVLFLISALNYPFTGDLKVQPEAMQTAIERFTVLDAHESQQP